MSKKDIRWEQRFSNYRKALAKMEEVVSSKKLSDLSDLEKEGLIQRFEYTYELAWKTLQDLFKHKGYQDILGPTPVLGQALSDGYITDATNWKRLKKSRELTSHTYDSKTAAEIAEGIYSHYFKLLLDLAHKLSEEQTGSQQSIF
ncbi:nucleotidyltransferase substrate binding protein [Owenweeksia hongkongensis]|uniref:nucleotidyltransferase substrate binding protein n=1 Tax=Owenweeksia hongkongensis TaxID=253245 RepID=UPI003A8E7700